MKYQDAEKAMYNKLPVIWNGIKYLRINALIHRNNLRRSVIQAELQDFNTNSVVITDIKNVEGV